VASGARLAELAWSGGCGEVLRREVWAVARTVEARPSEKASASRRYSMRGANAARLPAPVLCPPQGVVAKRAREG